MKTVFFKSALILFLISCLMFSLPACGVRTPDGPEPIGSDWRTRGTIDDYGTLVIGGEDIPVCLCCHSDDTAVYLDSETQELYATVVYPASLARETWESYSFDFSDRNGDGNSDIVLNVLTQDGAETVMTWLYDAAQQEFVSADTAEA